MMQSFITLLVLLGLSSMPALAQETLPAASEPVYSSPPAAMAADVRQELEGIQRQIQDLEHIQSLVSEIERMRGTRGMSQLLRNLQSELPDPTIYRPRMRHIQEQMTRSQERRIELSAGRASNATDIPSASIASEIEEHRELEEALRDLYVAQEEVVGRIVQTDRMIAERVLWLRGEPLTGGALAQLLPSGQWLTSPRNWKGALAALWADAKWSPLPYVFGAIVLLLILLLRNRLMRRMQPLMGPGALSRRDMLRQLALAILRSLPIPLALVFIGRRWAGSAHSDGFAVAVGRGMAATGFSLFAVLLLRRLAGEHGFIRQATIVSAERLKCVRVSLMTLAPFFIAAVAVLATVEARGIETYRYSLGRVAFLFAILSALLFVARGLWVGGAAWAVHAWRERLKRMLAPALMALMGLMMLMAAGGYYDAALVLARRLTVSLWLVLGVVILNALLTQWLQEKMQQMAMRQRLRELEREAAHVPADDLLPEAQATLDRQNEPDMHNMHQQTFRLVHLLLGLGLIVGLWLTWGDILPAFKVVGDKALWNVTAQAGAEKVLRPVTVAHVALALVIVIAMVVANRNLPALLEVAVLQHSTLEPASRYAVTTIVRYTILFAGIIGAFAVIGIGWSKVQWLAAAITVGLGFGLQEIFANFVSGLIILFERPIRIGDIVTIGGASGKVTRIRIRATTILDWEHKELIIPNKEFITGQVLNWTLSDTVVRLAIKVRVPYGTDVEKARQVLLEVAKAHPNILEDPAPAASISEFTDTNVILELFAHMPSLENFMRTKNEVYYQVEEAFAKAQIDFTWLQREFREREALQAKQQGRKSV